MAYFHGNDLTEWLATEKKLTELSESGLRTSRPQDRESTQQRELELLARGKTKTQAFDQGPALRQVIYASCQMGRRTDPRMSRCPSRQFRPSSPPPRHSQCHEQHLSRVIFFQVAEQEAALDKRACVLCFTFFVLT